MAGTSGLVRITPLAPGLAPQRLRLVVHEPGSVLAADAAFDVTTYSAGLTESGVRLAGRHIGGAFDVEVLCDPPECKDSRVHIRVAPRDLTGLPAAHAYPGVKLLAAMRTPNTLHLAAEHGPAFETPWPVEDQKPLVCTRCTKAIQALAELQPLVRTTLLIPDIHALDDQQHVQLVAAGRAVTGTAVPLRWHGAALQLTADDAITQFGDLDSANLRQEPVTLSFELEHHIPLPHTDVSVPGLILRISDARLTEWERTGEQVNVQISPVEGHTASELAYDPTTG